MSRGMAAQMRACQHDVGDDCAWCRALVRRSVEFQLFAAGYDALAQRVPGVDCRHPAYLKSREDAFVAWVLAKVL